MKAARKNKFQESNVQSWEGQKVVTAERLTLRIGIVTFAAQKKLKSVDG